MCLWKLRDTTLLISALGKLGTHCGISAPDSAKRYLWRAIDLACQFDSTQQYTEKSVLAGVYLFQGEYAQANKLAMDVLRHGKDYSYQNQYYYYAAMSFIKMGKIDSAKYVISIMPPPEDEVDSLTFYNLTAEISKAEGQLEQYGNNLYRSNKVESDILISSRKGELMVIDSIFEHKQSESRKTSIIKHNRVIILAGLILLLLLLFLILWMWWRHRAMLQEKAAMAMELEQALAGLQERQQNALDIDISRIVGLRLEAIRDLYQDIRVKDKDSSRVKKIVPLTSFLKSLHERNSLMPLEPKDSFWQKMKESVDGELNGIVSFVEQRYPELSERDLQFFTLICAKISPQLIRLCMDIKNAKSVTNIRGYLMKKMGLDMSFDEFVSKYMNGELK